jgi:NlpC/P60 family
MMMSHLSEREAVICEARRWEGTPYVFGACIRGVGASCSTFISGIFNEAIDAHLVVPVHIEQWWLNAKEQLYLDGLHDQGFVEIPRAEVQSGDLIVATTPQSRIRYCHGGLLLNWPKKFVIHCTANGVAIAKNLHSDWYFSDNPDGHKFYCWGGWR